MKKNLFCFLFFVLMLFPLVNKASERDACKYPYLRALSPNTYDALSDLAQMTSDATSATFLAATNVTHLAARTAFDGMWLGWKGGDLAATKTYDRAVDASHSGDCGCCCVAPTHVLSIPCVYGWNTVLDACSASSTIFVQGAQELANNGFSNGEYNLDEIVAGAEESIKRRHE